jgi:calcium binding protein 39
METILLLSQEINSSNLLPLLIQHMAKLDFESKKDVGQIFNNLLRRQIASRFPTADHLASKEESLLALIDAYAHVFYLSRYSL